MHHTLEWRKANHPRIFQERSPESQFRCAAHQHQVGTRRIRSRSSTGSQSRNARHLRSTGSVPGNDAGPDTSLPPTRFWKATSYPLTCPEQVIVSRTGCPENKNLTPEPSIKAWPAMLGVYPFTVKVMAV